MTVAKKHIVFLVLFCCCIFQSALGNNSTLVFLSTSQDIYESGDSVEIYARIFDAEYESLVPMGDLFVMIKSLDGDIVADARFKIENGVTSGMLKIPEWTNSGFYSVIAFTRDAFDNNNIRQLGIQHIYVLDDRKPSVYLNIETPKLIEKGNSFVVNLVIESLQPKQFSDTIEVKLFDFNGLLSVATINMTGRRRQIEIELPANFKKGLYLKFQSNNHNLIYKPHLLGVDNENYSVEFFPEGGKILTNSNQKIMYHCNDYLNRPVKLEGRIKDKKGFLVGDAKILQRGLGKVETKPATTDAYFFIPNKDGNNYQKFQLPRIEKDGAAITFHNAKNRQIELGITASGKFVNKDVQLDILSKGKAVYTMQKQLKSDNFVRIAVDSLPKGILKSVISSGGEILSERLIYNQQPLMYGMELKNDFVVRKDADSVSVKIFSGLLNQFYPIKAYDLKIVPASKYLFSEIAGTNSYLQRSMTTLYPENVLEIVLANMELIANSLIADIEPTGIKGQHTVGFVTDKKGNKIGKASVIAINMFTGNILKTKCDETGQFSFIDINTPDITWKAFKNGREYDVRLEHDFETSLNDFLKTNLFNQLQNVDLNTVFQKLVDASNLKSTSEKLPQRNVVPNDTNDLLELIKMIKPFYIRNNQIVFENQRPNFIQSGALFVINDRPMGTNISILNKIDPSKVLAVNIYSQLKDIEQFTSLNTIGVIYIKTSDYKQHESLTSVKTNKNLYWINGLELEDQDNVEVKIPSRKLNGNHKIIIDAVLENGQRIRTIDDYTF